MNENMSPMDDNEVAKFVSEQLAGRLLNNKYFKYTILSATIINSLVIVLETIKSLVKITQFLFASYSL